MKYRTIKEHHLFDKTFHRGERFSGKFVSCYVLQDYAAKRLKAANPQKEPYNRFGVSVGKKVGNAVARSRVKRILRAAWWQVEPDVKTGYLVVMVPRPGIQEAKSTEVAQDLRRGFARLGMMKEENPK